MSDIQAMIEALVDERVSEFVSENGVVTTDSFREAVEDSDVLADFGVLTSDTFDPSDFGCITTDSFDPDDVVSRYDLPDFDEFVRAGDVDIEDQVQNLLNSYNPVGGCYTARAATEALSLFFQAVLDGDLAEQRDALVNFLADPDTQVLVEATRAVIVAERKAAAKRAKKDAEKQRKAERKAAKAARKAEAERDAAEPDAEQHNATVDPLDAESAEAPPVAAE